LIGRKARMQRRQLLPEIKPMRRKTRNQIPRSKGYRSKPYSVFMQNFSAFVYASIEMTRSHLYTDCRSFIFESVVGCPVG
jgi:hypothetical protein